jgi:hypothetical protein
VLLAQTKGAQQPHRGQCMAVVLLQPAVSWGSKDNINMSQ